MTEDDLLQYVEDVLIPKGIAAHQSQPEEYHENALINALAVAKTSLDPEDIRSVALKMSFHSNGALIPAIGVRIKDLTNMLEQRQTSLKVKAKDLTKAHKELGGQTTSMRFGGRVMSTALIPMERMPDDLQEFFSQQQEENTKKRGRPKKVTQKGRHLINKVLKI